ncbi:coiled-coil domain-containing protein 81-like [Watersipora subatra]|uniref:coiled-coil domain-containing protein 81-like n=1 Tax=Watersipora subatra TaxID=2589382 RepID=UPI00355B0541
MPQAASEENIAGNIQDNRFYKLKRTGASADDIVNVWNYVSAYINSQMQKGKGVNITGLGQFTFLHRKSDVGNNKYLLVQRPVFVLSERFAQQHQISSTKHHLNGQVQVSDLNYSAVAFDTPFTRDVVEECVRDVINEFSRALSAGRNIEFSFATVGRLSIRNRKLKMRFYKEFINSFEGADEILSSMKDRPDTADSVMTRASSRAHSVNTMVLPNIGDTKASKAPLMAAIDENAEISLDDVGNIDSPSMQQAIEQVEKSGENYFGYGETAEGNVVTTEGYMTYGAQELDSMGLPPMLLEEAPNPATLAAKDMLRSGSRTLAPIAQAGGFSLDDMMPRTTLRTQRSPSVTAGMGDITVRSACGSAPPPGLRRSATLPLDVETARVNTLSPIPKPTNQSQGACEDRGLPAESSGIAWPAQTRVETPEGSQCGHSNAGQELCYLCHQRAARNIPVSFEDEKKRRELEEDQILNEFQVMKNNEFILGEQEKNLARRHALQKQAAFNLGVAEAINEKKNARPERENARAYIFQRRPLTPPRYIKQQQLQGFLTKQIDHKDGVEKKGRADKEFLERLEQVQLAEDLAAQRDQYLKERHSEREKYKDALATQLKYKPLQVPDRLPDTEVFGKNDTTEADIILRKEHAKKIASEQLATVADKKRAEILKRLQEQEDQDEKIRKSKADLLEDRARRYERIVKNRKTLEADWVTAAEQKKGREIEERLRCLTPGSLIHEQCDRYKRCTQCKRRTTNSGETNLWKESYYIPGARIMV